MRKPRLTIAVRRGLLDVMQFAQYDFEADQSNDCPLFTGKRRTEFERAMDWISAHAIPLVNKETK